MSYGIQEIDLKGKILFANKAYHQMLGYADGELLGLDMQQLIPKTESAEMIKRMSNLSFAQKTHTISRCKNIKKDGSLIDIEITWERKEDADGHLSGFVAVIIDFTKRKGSEDLNRSAATVFENTTEGILITNVRSEIIFTNRAFTTITGYTQEEVLGKNPRFLQSGKHDKTYYENMWKSVYETGRWQGQIWNRKKNGALYLEWLTLNLLRNTQGDIIQHIAIFSDISKQKHGEEAFRQHAFFDPLTNLGNRTLFYERLSQTIKQTRRNHSRSAVLFIDLDHFKEVNDTFGHEIGDKILIQTADILLSCVREIDTVARFGGDEFLILLTDITGKLTVADVAKKIIDKLCHPFQFDDQDIFLGASIGIAIIPDDNESEKGVIKNADMALYKAKAAGRNTFHFFNEQLKIEAKKNTLLGADLKYALKRNELVIYYQPIVDLHSLETVSIEALVRWNHPDQGLLLPDRFIPLAENSNLICEIGEWVLMTACKQMRQWQKDYGIDSSISVNMSSKQFKYKQLDKLITKALQESGLPAKFLAIEITESLMFGTGESPIAMLETIKKLGVKLSIDDFGTGYSSLSYLLQFPVDLLKIDKSFISNMGSSSKKKSLVEAIIRMAQSLNLKVIAEGIETQEDLSSLMALGCHMAQGYYFSRPLSASDYEIELVLQKRILR